MAIPLGFAAKHLRFLEICEFIKQSSNKLLQRVWYSIDIYFISFDIMLYHLISFYIIYALDAHELTPSILGQVMERGLAVGATSGSVSALLLRLFATAWDPASCPACDLSCDCPLCPELPQVVLNNLDLTSVLVGIFLGLLIGPTLDFLHLVRQSWTVWLRSRLASLAAEDKQPLYCLA